MKPHLLFFSALSTSASMLSAATVLITPTEIFYQGTQQGLGNPTALIDGSGLSEAPTISNYVTVTHSSAAENGFNNIWVTVDLGAGGGDFFGDGGQAQAFTIDLRNSYIVDGFVQWGYNFGTFNANQAQVFTFQFSNDGGLTYHTTLSDVTVPRTGAANVADETRFAPTRANFIRMTLIDNFYDGSTAGGDRIGIAELRFTGDVIPEPSVALLGGLGVLGVLRRRRA